jgi:hypothetical protein
MKQPFLVSPDKLFLSIFHSSLFDFAQCSAFHFSLFTLRLRSVHAFHSSLFTFHFSLFTFHFSLLTYNYSTTNFPFLVNELLCPCQR